MRVLALAPAYADSPIDGLHVAVQRRWGDRVVLLGSGRPPGTVSVFDATRAEYDLVLMADPCRRGSEFWPVKGVRAPVKAVILHDTCYGVERQLRWAAANGVNMLLLRVKADVPMVAAATRNWDPQPYVGWQPFGFDPHVFHGDPAADRRVDVIITGHLGHVYPERERAQRTLTKAAEQGRFRLDDMTLHGCAHPEVTGANFARRLASAKVAVVTTNVHRYLLMKYYEAPACGCTMLCEPAANGFREFFQPWPGGRHCVTYEGDGLLPAIDMLLGNEEFRSSIASGGHRHVHECHTNDRRVDLLLDHIVRAGHALPE